MRNTLSGWAGKRIGGANIQRTKGTRPIFYVFCDKSLKHDHLRRLYLSDDVKSQRNYKCKQYRLHTEGNDDCNSDCSQLKTWFSALSTNYRRSILWSSQSLCNSTPILYCPKLWQDFRIHHSETVKELQRQNLYRVFIDVIIYPIWCIPPI